MMESKEISNKKNIAYIPGWMDKASLYGDFSGVEIWERKIDPSEKIECQAVVAHSLGTHFAILNWLENRNTTIFLVNPLLEKRSLFGWFFVWIKFFLREGIIFVNFKRIRIIVNFFNDWRLAKKLLSEDYWKLINFIPKSNIFIIRGERDNFFCRQTDAERFKKMGIKVFEISGMGHAIGKKYISQIESIVCRVMDL